jgi:hypothetical protein
LSTALKNFFSSFAAGWIGRSRLRVLPVAKWFLQGTSYPKELIKVQPLLVFGGVVKLSVINNRHFEV